MDWLNAVPTEKLALLIPFVAILGAALVAIAGIVSFNARKAQQTELETMLKRQMLEQGFSAEEIERVLDSGSASGSRARRYRLAKREVVRT